MTDDADIAMAVRLLNDTAKGGTLTEKVEFLIRERDEAKAEAISSRRERQGIARAVSTLFDLIRDDETERILDKIP